MDEEGSGGEVEHLGGLADEVELGQEGEGEVDGLGEDAHRAVVGGGVELGVVEVLAQVQGQSERPVQQQHHHRQTRVVAALETGDLAHDEQGFELTVHPIVELVVALGHLLFIILLA